MTPKQIEKVKNKIKKIRKEIYDEKRLWGGYHDGRGLRYIPFELYLKIQDFKGGLTYLRWFDKNFPNDNQMPEIMLMASLICFKNNRIIEAEKKATLAYSADNLILYVFLDKQTTDKDKENSHWDLDAIKKFCADLKKQNDLTDFKNWLDKFMISETLNNYKKSCYE